MQADNSPPADKSSDSLQGTTPADPSAQEGFNENVPDDQTSASDAAAEDIAAAGSATLNAAGAGLCCLFCCLLPAMNIKSQVRLDAMAHAITS